ncbi:MAG: replication protein [Dehalococcoidia bacterium]
MNELETGYTKVPNEILEALSRMNVPGEVGRILHVIIRKTMGWNKIDDQISLGQFSKMTGLKRQNVVRAISKAYSHGLIHKNEGGIYSLNINVTEWMPFQRAAYLIQADDMLSGRITPVIHMENTGDIQPDNELVSVRIHTKDTKETITKETHTKEMEIALRGARRPLQTFKDTKPITTPGPITPAPYETYLTRVTTAPSRPAGLAEALQCIHPVLATKDFRSLCGLMGTYLNRLNGNHEYLMQLIWKTASERPADPVAYIGGAIRNTKNHGLPMINRQVTRDPDRYTNGKYGHIVMTNADRYRVTDRETGETWEGYANTPEHAARRAGNWNLADCEIEKDGRKL